MPRPRFARPRVLVTGSGLMGLWPALLLAQKGCPVTVLEADTAPRGASWAAAGMLAPASETAEAQHNAGMAGTFGRHSLNLWHEQAAVFAAHGHDICWRPFGALLSAFDDQAMAALEAARRAALALEMTPLMLSPAQARKREAALGKGLRGALMMTEEASVDPRRVLRALQAMLIEAGGVVRPAMRVRAITATGKTVQVRCADGQRLEADRLVLAAGHACGRIDGLENVPGATLSPVKGQMLALEARPDLVRAVVRDARAYIVPRGDGRIVIGATSEPGKADSATDARTMARLHQGAAAVLPALADAPVVERWAGVRPQSADGLPVIGAAGMEGVFINGGHYRNGVLLAPASAALLCALVLDEEPGQFAKALAPARIKAALTLP